MTSVRKLFTPLDIASIGFLTVLILLSLIFSGRVDNWGLLVLIDLAVIAGIAVLAWFAATRPGRLLIGLHRWYSYPLVLFVFKQLYFMVRPIHPIDYDDVFIAIDRWIFGTDPTVWMAQFSSPIITEVLQIAYFSYYLLFIILGVEIYRRFPVREFDNAVFLIVYGFYLSYIGYFLMPAVGPRFTLHEFSAMSTELPGLFLTETLRDIINAGESIPKNALNPVEVVQRDVFPSGHTQLTLVTAYLAFQYKLRSRFFIGIMASLLIIGTVYLRYHYVVDLMGGVVFFGLTIWSGKAFHGWWTRDAAAQEGAGRPIPTEEAPQ
jgi:membrane-associated phospholipid phosphatase